MARVAVFDSGLGSLSLVGPIMRATRGEVIYLADRRSYPYGAMRVARLREAVSRSIGVLRARFSPDAIVVGSNTPSLLVPELLGGRTVGVLPPVREAVAASRTRSVAVLATRSAARSDALARHIARERAGRRCDVARIDATALVDIAERMRFLTQKPRCVTAIRDTLHRAFERRSIDAATLSSTHLPLLLPLLRRTMPHVTFVDPAASVAARVARIVGVASGPATLSVHTTSAPARLAADLARLGMPHKVSAL